MRKYIIAGLMAAGLAMAAEYAVTTVIPVKTEVTTTNVTESVTAVKFVLERFIADVETTNTSFRIVGSYRDADGKILRRRTIMVPMAQARLIMPEVDDVMGAAQLSVAANIEALLAE